MLEELLFWCLFPLHPIIPAVNVIFPKVAWLSGLSFAGGLGRRKVDWPGTGCESDLNIVSYAHTWSIVGECDFCNLAVLLVRQISNLAMLKWELWSGRHRVWVWKPTCFTIWAGIWYVKIRGSGISMDCADSTVRCWGPAWALCRCGIQKFAGLPL